MVTMLNPILWKKVQGQKHPARLEISERKIHSVKMLFETNTNGHKHPSINLVIIEQLVKPKIWYNARHKSGVKGPHLVRSRISTDNTTPYNPAIAITSVMNNTSVTQLVKQSPVVELQQNKSPSLRFDVITHPCPNFCNHVMSSVDSGHLKSNIRFYHYFLYKKKNRWAWILHWWCVIQHIPLAFDLSRGYDTYHIPRLKVRWNTITQCMLRNDL